MNQRAQIIIDNWQKAGILHRKIVLNTPEVWEYTETKHKALCEPMIKYYQKFNSNSGW